MPTLSPIDVREYGNAQDRAVVLLHGGPGAPGYMAPLARDLAARGFHILEPLQRGSASGISLTVERHILDMRQILSDLPEPPILLGSSWGAMLAAAYAAAYPIDVRAIAMVGSGTFGLESRAEFSRRKETFGGARFQAALDALQQDAARENLSEHEVLLRHIALIDDLYSFELISTDLEVLEVDGVANQQSWRDMIELQEQGVYPQHFARITCPVLLLHGDVDPHPGDWIRDELLPHIPQLEYVELARCGHYPWMERFAREDFLKTIATWLRENIPSTP